MQNQNYKVEEKAGVVYVIPNQHKETLIWLHGLGDTPQGFLDIFTSPQGSPVYLTTKVVMPTAPIRKVTINMGFESTSWFDIKDFYITGENFEEQVSIPEIMESAKVINKLIEDESKIVGAQRVFVGGFSQGCCIALHCGLEFPQRLGGIIGLSGFLFPLTKIHEKNQDTPIFISHGGKDIIIQWKLAKPSYERLEEKEDERKPLIINLEPQAQHEVTLPTLLKVKLFYEGVAKKQ